MGIATVEKVYWLGYIRIPRGQFKESDPRVSQLEPGEASGTEPATGGLSQQPLPKPAATGPGQPHRGVLPRPARLQVRESDFQVWPGGVGSSHVLTDSSEFSAA